jgi:hypothetical protein
MSDFSAAIIIRAEHEAIALEYLDDDFLIRLNKNWLCRLSANDEINMMDISKYSKTVLNLSEQIPLMHVVHPEDHGFEMCILHKRNMICHFGVSYEFGELDMKKSPEFAERMGIGRFIEDEFKQFKLFGFDDKACAKILASFNELDMNDLELKIDAVSNLFSVLGIEEFSFVSHHYVNSDKEQGTTHFDVIKW